MFGYSARITLTNFFMQYTTPLFGDFLTFFCAKKTGKHMFSVHRFWLRNESPAVHWAGNRSHRSGGYIPPCLPISVLTVATLDSGSRYHSVAKLHPPPQNVICGNRARICQKTELWTRVSRHWQCLSSPTIVSGSLIFEVRIFGCVFRG